MTPIAFVAGLITGAAGGAAGLVGSMVTGKLTLDLGWGRSTHPLGPVTVRIAAPRELVFEQLSSPYLGRTPRAAREQLEVVERGQDMVLAAHHTRLGPVTATTVETVRFEPPERVTFRLVRGPVPHVVEEFLLTPHDEGTELRYTGELGIDFWMLGALAARQWVRPTWERVVREHLAEAKLMAERRAEARSRRRDAT